MPPEESKSDVTFVTGHNQGELVQNLIATLLLPLIVVIGLIVLVALGKVTADVAVPIIAGLAGVHLGANATIPPSTGGKPPSAMG